MYLIISYSFVNLNLIVSDNLFNSYLLLFVILNYSSLKRKSTTNAKRQSFILETKHFRTNKQMIEKPKLPSKFFSIRKFNF